METVIENIGVEKYPVYKDSGIAWLDKIPSNWTSKPLFTIGKVKSEVTCHEKELLSVYLDKGVIRFSDVTEKRTNVTSEDLSKYQVVEPGNLVLNNQQAWRGSVGVSKYSGIVSPAYIVLSLSNEIDFNFANYLFRDSTMVYHYLICSKGVGTIQRNLYWYQLRRVNICLPPIEEQIAIAAFLDRKTALIDQAIGIKQKQIELLKERRQILIHKAVTRGLNPNVKLKDSGVEYLGKIPDKWNIIKFKYIIRTKARLGWKGLKASEYVDNSEYGFLSTPNIKGENIDYSGAYFITKKRYEESPEIMLQKGDILLVKDGSTLGIINIVKELPFYCTVNSSIAVLRITNINLLDANYVNYFLKSDYSQNIIELKKDGMGVPHLFQSDINNFIALMPPIQEQLDIVIHIENQTSKIATAISLKEHEIEKLIEYKATLINSAVTGKIKVS